MLSRTWRTCAARSLRPFPGAPNSSLTTSMGFLEPSSVPPLPTYHVMNSSGEMEDPARAPPDVTNEQALEWYQNMLTVNIMDSIMFEAQRHGRLSFYMVSAGEEAVMVGSAAALTPTDVITCQYRETGVFLQRGFTLTDFMSQLAANHNDPGKGRNMPVHYSGKKKVNVHAVASTLATQIPHATGAAYALKMDAMEDPTLPPSVAACYFGDGAASEGDFHAALNVAAVRKCPIIFICRNNGFAISTPTSEQYVGDGIAVRGLGYGIPSIRVDGTDIFAVYEATREARRRALENGGQPVLIEFMSYRISHHSTSDDSMAYRSQAEVQTWKTRHNPVTRLKTWLENQGLWDEERDKEARARIRKSILRELVEAEKKPKPRLSGIFDDVYAELTEEAQEQREEMIRLMTKYPEEYDIDTHIDGIKGL
ncbi:thiamine diphosphate-binding protein [Aspergillus germanicus]